MAHPVTEKPSAKRDRTCDGFVDCERNSPLPSVRISPGGFKRKYALKCIPEDRHCLALQLLDAFSGGVCQRLCSLCIIRHF